MPRKQPELTKESIKKVRATLGRKASAIGNRMADYCLGVDGVEMTATQVNAGKVVLSHVLPAQVSQEVADVTESTMTATEMRKKAGELRQEIIKSLKPEEIAKAMKSLPAENADA